MMLLEDVMNNTPVVELTPEPQPVSPNPAQPTEPTEPTQGTEPTEPTEPTQPQQTEQQPAAPATQEPADSEPEFRLPGQQDQQVDEVDWLRQHYAQSLNQIATLQQQVNEFQLAGLDDEERTTEELRLHQQQLEQQLQQFQQAQAFSGWQRYYSQFIDNPQELEGMQDVVQMGHHVLTSLNKQLRQATKELEALKTASQPSTTPVPPIVTGGGTPAPQRTMTDLTYNPKEFERLMDKARQGLLTGEDIPPIT